VQHEAYRPVITSSHRGSCSTQAHNEIRMDSTVALASARSRWREAAAWGSRDYGITRKDVRGSIEQQGHTLQ
jgi:hypothetical protein